MKEEFDFVNISYSYKDKCIKLIGRNQQTKERQQFNVHDFKPYFYVPEDDIVTNGEVSQGFKSLDGKALQKIILDAPSQISEEKDKYSEHYESDIPFIRRFLIDKGIRGTFSVDEIGAGTQSDNIMSSGPAEGFSPKACWYDIEVETETTGRMPDKLNPINKVIAISWYDSSSKKYFTCLVDRPTGIHQIQDNWNLEVVATEQELIKKFASYLDWAKPDVLCGWNIIGTRMKPGFDNDYLRNRAAKLHIPIDIDSAAHFDLLVAYRKTNFKASNRLKDVVLEEGITDTVVSDQFEMDLYSKNRGKFLSKTRLTKSEVPDFIKYSMDDVKYCVQINDKSRSLDFWWTLRNFVGAEKIATCFSHGTMVDMSLLRLAKERNVVLKHQAFDEVGTFAGAAVFEPKPGIHKDIAVFDMAMYYPSIILSLKLSPETRDGTGILCQLVEYFKSERQRYDKLLSEQRPGTEEYEVLYQKWYLVKFLLNAVWGYVGWAGSRIYDKEICSTITGTARDGLNHCKTTVNNLGYDVIYGDTDSIAIKSQKEKGYELEKVINDSLKEWSEEKGWEPYFSIKYEKFYNSMVFVEAKGGGGAKKKYAAHQVWLKGKDVDIIEIKGFDAIRRDNSVITKNLQRELLDKIARGHTDGIKELVADTIKDMRSGALALEDICLKKNLNKELSGYKGSADFVTAVEYSNKFLGTTIVGGDRINLLHVLKVPGFPPTKMIAFIEKEQIPKGTEINMEKMIEKTIRMKMENILKIVGIDWNDVNGQANLSDMFGGNK